VSNYPSNNRYTKDHEWIAQDGDLVTLGITEFAQGELGDVIFVELPEAGLKLAPGEPFGTIEAVKTVEEIFSPLSGEVVEVNGEREGQPELVNQDPFGAGWFVKIRISDSSELDGLMDTEAYLAMVGE
jgi:glycine cleavage system H protein